jgi:alkylation response protein AidB-like acyl-CoA dehydrogenase
MALVLNEEQRLLRDTARDFLADNAPVAQLRKLRDDGDATGYSEELWCRMAEMGWASIILPEEYGGLDFGFTGLGVVMEEAGRRLTASPLLSSAVVGASCLLLGGSSQQKEQILPHIAGGQLTLALALEESHHHSPTHIATTAQRREGNFLISGKKTFVLDGHVADKLIVVARTSGETNSTQGISLFLVERSAQGVSCQRNIMVDSRNSATIEFDKVTVAGEQLIGACDDGWQVLEPVLDRARIAMAAEMMGCALEAFERTVGYLKERVQFDVAIGSFQALQHRAAHIQSELELSRSVVLQALSSVDETPEQVPMLASLAKANLNELVKLVSNEAIQMHGGIGVTDDFDIGLFLKRARVAMQVFGDTGYHKNRYACLCGY